MAPMQGFLKKISIYKLWSKCCKKHVFVSLIQHIHIYTDLFFLPLIWENMFFIPLYYLLYLRMHEGPCSSSPQHQLKGRESCLLFSFFKDAIIIRSPRKVKLGDSLSSHFTLMT